MYTSLSLSLAALETFVHLDPALTPEDLVYTAAQLPVELIDCERVAAESLPPDWRQPNHPALQQMGTAWARSIRSLALLVPSAVIEEEWNALLNPSHPRMAEVKQEPHKPFRFDARMFR